MIILDNSALQNSWLTGTMVKTIVNKNGCASCSGQDKDQPSEQGEELINIMSSMLIGGSGHGLFVITINVCVLLIYGKLEGPRDTKLGTWSINDIQMLLQKFDPNPSDGEL